MLNKHVKKLLITGASLLMITGAGVGLSNVMKPAHADMPWPEYYYSSKHKDPVYYDLDTPYDHGYKYRDHYIYTKMPNVMRRRNFIFGLYYGDQFKKHPVFKVLHRRGQTYLPAYTGANDDTHNIYFHGYKGNLLNVYVNKRDIGRRVKDQNKVFGKRNTRFTGKELGLSYRSHYVKRTKKHNRSNHHYSNYLGSNTDAKKEYYKYMKMNKTQIFRHLIKNKKFKNSKYEYYYNKTLNRMENPVKDGNFSDFLNKIIRHTHAYLLGNHMTKKAISDYYLRGKPNRKLMKRNAQYRRAYKGATAQFSF